MRNVLSIFPNGIDPRVCFSDCDLEGLAVFDEYNELIAQGKYDEAARFMENSDVDYYGAWIFNLLERRLRNIGKYLLEQESPDLVRYSSYAPEGVQEGMCWVGDNVLNSEEDDIQ